MVASRFPVSRVSIAVSTLAAGLLLGGCASSGGSGDEPSPKATETAKALTTNTLVGTWGSTAVQEPNLVFDAEGGLTGTDGCNRLVGTWSVEGDTVLLSDIASTLMACEGVDTWLSGAASATLVAGNDDELQIFDSADQEIGTLERAD
ncbi:META domain-containing protein [Mycetocola zhadangensis]|uniref:META domain-containing protein n=1 Tax=Mycetocola zhadangensis TaxID=1164595 RepID=A0A3L7J240_9MICO|nr:META domain-containing protein [Mycetocola zhadangensis]RLQ84626.1 META domain-containing protein [Mycetocola zhadangensis]